MPVCCVRNCYNSREKCMLMFFNFPRKDEERKKQWIEFVGEEVSLTLNSLICEVHFAPDQWLKPSCKLKPSAIPTLKCKICPDRKGRKSRSCGDHVYCKAASGAPKSEKNSERATVRIPSSDISSDHQKQEAFKKADHIYFKKEPPTGQGEIIKLKRKDYMKENPLEKNNCSLTNKPVIIFPQEIFLHGEEKENVNPNINLEEIKGTDNKVVDILRAKVADLEKRMRECKREKKKVENSKEMTWLKGTFSEKQLRAIKTGKTRGSKWSNPDVRKGLRHLYASGEKGYNRIRKEIPLPAPRTLRERTEHIKMAPGILIEVLQAFAPVVQNYSLNDRDCALFFDEMSVEKRKERCKSLDGFIGDVTLPGIDDLATKAIAFVLGGLHARWKVTVAYHFTNDFGNPEQVADTVLELLFILEYMGLNVMAVVCDMGNRDVLTALGFSTTKDRMIYGIPHPANPKKTLFAVPDVVHLFKSLKEVLANNEIILLPDDIVASYGLQSGEVHFSHIEWLEEFERNKDLKLVPQLKQINLKKGDHFRKMKVGNARNVINHKVGEALNYLSKAGRSPEPMDGTSWFILLMNRWFELLSSRSLKLALSQKNESAYNAALNHLRLVIHVMSNMKVGVKGHWKVVQTHIIMATQALIDISDILLKEKGYSFVMICKFLQDIVENLFSIVRYDRKGEKTWRG